MGMFDYICCEYPLPDDPPEWVQRHAREGVFQTKDTEAQFLETYTITADGKLIHHAMQYESVPENERPYWGTPEWETSPFSRACGCIRAVPRGDVELSDFHRDLRFYTSNDTHEFFEYIARFTNGRLQHLKPAPRHPEFSRDRVAAPVAPSA